MSAGILYSLPTSSTSPMSSKVFNDYNHHKTVMPESTNMALLRKAVYLNNIILQMEKKSYIEIELQNSQDKFIYYYPATSETILEMDADLAMPCMIVYTIFKTHRNINRNDMIQMNNVFKLLKKKYDDLI